MADYGERVADNAISATEKKLRKIYEQASKELRGKLVGFNEKFAKKQAEMRTRLEAGEITKEAYESWLRGQVFIGRQWAQKADQASRMMTDANKEAAQLVRQGSLNVFAENYNYTAYELDKQAGAFLNFNLYNTESVEKLVRKKPQMLPEWKIDEKKDYKWNRQKVENAITQGIIQGKRIDEITKDLVDKLCTTNNNKMRMFSRTAMTGAQNAGRKAQMEDAEEQGIKVKKRWLATLDNRTRDAHQELDGQTVPIKEPFKVNWEGETYELDYPGDPSGEPCMVFNCRCTMIEIYDGIDRKSVRRDMDNQLVEDMTYKEWKAMKEGVEQEPTALEAKIEEANKGTNIFGESISFSDKMNSPKWDEAKAVINNLTTEFETKLKEVKPGAQNSAGTVQISGTVMNLSSAKPETAIHEFAHTISVFDQTKFGLYDESGFWNEIRKVRTEYRKERKENPLYYVSTYADSENKIDEFMAESFTMAYMMKNGFEMPDKYGDATKIANEVFDIVKKFFGKKR